MKNLYFLLFTCILFSSIAKAQTPQYHWMNQLGGTGNDGGGYVAVDKNGDVITASSIGTASSFKPGTLKEFKFLKTTSILVTDLVLTKVNSVGDLFWSKQIGSVIPMSICTDNLDNIILVGSFQGTVDFDPGVGFFNLTSKAASDIFILKLNAKGDFLWAGNIEGTSIESAVSVKTDKNDNIALICQFDDTVDVDMSIGVHNFVATSKYEAAVLKINSIGKFLWAHHLKDITPSTISFDSGGNLYSAGSFSTTKDFDFGAGVFNMTSTGSAASTDVYVLKEDTAGKFLWAKSFGEFINQDNPTSIAVDKSDNVIIAGNCGGGNSDFDPGPGVVNLVGNTDFILKLSSSGNYIWAKGINGGSVPFEFTVLGLDDSNNVFATGFFNTSVDFDPGASTLILSPIASRDVFILQLDSSGLFNWANQLKCTNSILSRSMVISGSGNIYLGGSFTLKTDFDPGLGTKIDSAVGGTDVFTLKLSRCLLNNSIILSECKYFNYAGYRFDSSEKLDFLFNSVAGCDSVVTVDMTIKKVNDTISVSGSVVNAKSSSASAYQWVNCPSYSAIAGATSASFTATVTGNYALIITENGCTDTSDCVSVTGLSIQEAQQSEAISISPNPSKGMFNLSLPSEIKGKLEIKSIDGKILYSELISSTKLTIDLSNYSSGLYILNITDSKGKKIVEKLMKY